MPEFTGSHCSENESRRNAILVQLQVATLESEMAQTALLEKEKKRLRLCSELNSLSPINQLPTEIKGEIFHNALRLLTNSAGDVIEPLATPFLLGKICQGWRDFVWSCPMFWTNLHLHLSRDRYEAQTRILREWLSKTAKCPLSFQLTTSESWDCWTSQLPPTEILATFASVSLQWKEVDLFLPDTLVCFDAIFTNSLPLLTTATVRLVPTSDRQLHLFSTAPQLSKLHLYGPYLANVRAPWHQLKHFSSDSCTLEEIRRFFNGALKIIHCTFRNIESIVIDESPRSLDTFHRLPVLDHLEYLRLEFYSISGYSTQILGPVELPSLRKAYVRGEFASLPAAILPQIMTPFRSSFLLEEVTLGETITSDDLIEALENIPSVKILRLQFDHFNQRDKLPTEELLGRLYQTHDDILLPNLQSFTISGPISLKGCIHLFRDVLVYRFHRECALHPAGLDCEQRTIRQIQEVNVRDHHDFAISPDVQRELRSLQREGLVLSLLFWYSLEDKLQDM